MRSLIDSTLRENLDILTEDVLLNGAGTADEPAGILATSGVLQQAFSTDVVTTIRKAITKLRVTSGATIQGVLLNPADDEAWDLLKDASGRYYGLGPFGSGPGTAWGYERIVSQSVAVGQAIIGDFSTIHLLDLEPLAVEAFNQHKDYAQRNLTYIRAEKRAVQLIRNAARLCVVDLTA
jgi:HK97 family phage major capsid protein